MRIILAAACVLTVTSALATDFEVLRTVSLGIGEMEGKGQIQSPQRSPGGEALSFEFLAANGDTLEVYVAEIENPDVFPPRLKTPVSVMGAVSQDVFSLAGPGDKPVSEQAAWGPSTKRGTQLVFAATRREASRGGAQINFDLMYVTKGKRRFLTDHPENDSSPTFTPDGDYVVFTSGRSGEGDLYSYSFFGEGNELTRLTFEETGSELNATFSPDGKSLAYIEHTGGWDHLYVVDEPRELMGIKDDAARVIRGRAKMRDLTPNWRNSASAPSFSPDSKWIAFYVHPKGQVMSDLYVVRASGGEARLLMEGVVAGSGDGPAWNPDSDGLFVVEENAQLMNPIVWVPLDPSAARKRLNTNTELNADIDTFRLGSTVCLVYAAQGGGEKDAEKRWRKVFATQLGRR